MAPRVVFGNLSQNVMRDVDMGLEMGISSLPKPQSMAKAIQRGRQKLLNCPPIPKNWASMVIPDSLKVSSSGEPWVIIDTSLKTGEKVGLYDCMTIWLYKYIIL